MARTEGTESPETEGSRSSLSRWGIPLGIVALAAALITGVLWLQPGGDEAPEEAGAPQEQAAIEHPEEVAVPDLSSEESRDPDDLLAEGPVDAPVVIVVFTDFQCPYCAQWSHETAPVIREYVERGEVRIEWRDVNVYGEDSERAARAGLAAAMQGAHVEYHEALFPDGEIRSSGELSEEALIELADDLGLDTERFAEDLSSEQVARTIEDNARQGIDLGAMSTPSFLIGGTPMVGAQPTEVFTEMVDEALAEAGH